MHSHMLIQKQEAESPGFPELGNPNIGQVLIKDKFNGVWLRVFTDVWVIKNAVFAISQWLSPSQGGKAHF